jgi:hypothetical protein
MKFSTMTKEELIESYDKMSKHMDFGQVEAGLTRHYLDHMWGVSVSRALISAIKTTGRRFQILSTGRVQGPTLHMLYKHEKKIKAFKPKPFWEINAQIKIGKNTLEAEYEEEKIWDKKEADDAFGFDIIGAGLMPVRVIFDNKGKHMIDIVANQTFLVDVDNNLWPVLEEKMAYDRLQKKTELGKVAPEGGKYGMLGGIAGGVIGAAIGIVSGHNVADAAMKGAALGAAGGIMSGGLKGMSDTDVQAQIRSDLEKRSLERRSVMPGEIAQGFIFFPGESKKAMELRLQIKEADTGKTYSLIMKF